MKTTIDSLFSMFAPLYVFLYGKMVRAVGFEPYNLSVKSRVLYH